MHTLFAMARPVRRLACIPALAAALLCGPLSAQEIRIGGTGNALGTMRLLGDAFTRSHPGSRVIVLDSIGTSGAIKAVPKGAIDIGLSSRPLTPEEAGTGVVVKEYARTPTVLAVSARSQVTAISRTQLADLYAGKLIKWPDGTAIRPVLRQPGDDNTRQLKELSPAIAAAVVEADQRPGLPFAVNDQEATDKMETIPGAIGVTALSLILSEKRALRALKLDDVAPTVDNGATGKYPIYKRFFMVTRTQASNDVGQFMAFVASPAGRDILARNGHWLP